MNQEKDYIAQLQEIRRMMEHSSRFISLSGWSGILAGCFALAGAWLSRQHYLGQSERLYYSPGTLLTGPTLLDNPGFYSFYLMVAGLVVLLSLTVGMVLTQQRARRKGQRIWDRVARRMLINLAIPLASGGLFCLMLLLHGLVGLLIPTMLIFYGLSLIHASKYTIHDIKYFGLSQVVLGCIALFVSGHGLLFWSVGFGVFHLVYGTFMWLKYERNA